MKKFLRCFFWIILFGIFTIEGKAQSLKSQKFVPLDMLDSLYKVNKYTLSTQELYGVDEIIEVYNVNIAGVALFSVLPDFQSESNWTEVILEDIQSGLLSDREFNRIVRDKAFSGASRTKTMDFRLVKKEDDNYWVSNVCLLELFRPNAYISDIHPSIFNVHQGTINIQQTPLKIVQMMEVFEESINWRFPMDVRENVVSFLPNREELEREYLSRVFEINASPAYQFWTLTDWSSRGGYSYNRGVDRFIYMPDKGIVAGSYDFYFLADLDKGWPDTNLDLRPRHLKTKEEIWQNVIHEKVMLAEELKAKSISP